MIRGERFEVNLDSDDEQDASSVTVPAPLNFVGDVLERKPATTAPPSAPTLKSSTGFPGHAKRKVDSRFKQRNSATDKPPNAIERTDKSISNGLPSQVYLSASNPQDGGVSEPRSWEEDEKQRIDAENRQRLADMSSDEIEEARAELMSSLSPAMIQRLLKRSNIDSGSNEGEVSDPVVQTSGTSVKPKSTKAKTVSFAEEPAVPIRENKNAPEDEETNVDGTQTIPSFDDHVHFPRAPQAPDLDPNSDTFLEDLHQKYFPSLPAEPDKLEWMQASSTKSAYDPSAASLNPNEIRFDFKGDLLPPRLAAQVPVSAGLHHHGDAPEAAGYTIPELAHLSRSTYAAQRCIAFQTLGRILYKLGKGDFGDAGESGANTVVVEDTFGELARGLWREVENEHVIEQLVAESEGNGVDGGRHISAKAYATEAVWLWRKGGGRRWKAE